MVGSLSLGNVVSCASFLVEVAVAQMMTQMMTMAYRNSFLLILFTKPNNRIIFFYLTSYKWPRRISWHPCKNIYVSLNKLSHGRSRDWPFEHLQPV